MVVRQDRKILALEVLPYSLRPSSASSREIILELSIDSLRVLARFMRFLGLLDFASIR
jgi:hypothetical protein